MEYYYNCGGGGGCFHGSCSVRMNDGTLKRVDCLLKGDKVSIIIYDLSGKLIYQKEIVIEDFNEKTYSIIPSEKLAPGVYLVKGIHNDYIDNKRLIVE